MRFCDKCGSYMQETKDGFVCRRCGLRARADAGVQTEDIKKRDDSSLVFVVNRSENDYVKVSQVCPECGNGEAFRWLSRVSGEHAGVGRERTVKHFRCTRCSRSWSKTS